MAELKTLWRCCSLPIHQKNFHPEYRRYGILFLIGGEEKMVAILKACRYLFANLERLVLQV